MKKVIITGPTGTIGIALIKQCIVHNIEVLAIVRENSTNIKYIPNSPLVKIIECNIDKYNTLNLNENYDVFIHFAWDGTMGKDRDNLYHQLDNVKYTLDAVHIAKRSGCSLFIGAGSQAEYGRSNSPLSSNTFTQPETGYGIAKLAAGHMSRNLCEMLNLRHLWVRILSIYGPYDDPKTLIMSLIENIHKNTEMNLSSGEQIWDYLYSKDAANAFYLLSTSNLNNKTYCLGSGVGKPLKEYINTIRDLINPNYKLKLGTIPFSSRQLTYLCADISDLTKDTGFTPQTSFKDGILELLNEAKNS